MIDDVITETPGRLSPGGRLFMVQNSVTDFPKSMGMMQALGLKPRVIEVDLPRFSGEALAYCAACFSN